MVTLWNSAPRVPGNGQTTCTIFTHVVVRPVGRLRSPSRTFKFWGTHVQLQFLQEHPRGPVSEWPFVIGGVVRLKVFVKPDGSVRDSEVLGGNPILAESAQKSVMQWKFSSASSETAIELSVTFDPHADSGG